MDHFGANMEPLKSVTLGAMGSLLRKLDELARTEDAARQLQDDLDTINANLSKLSMAEDPSITANYWMKDVRELSYDMEDCVDQYFLADDSDAKMAWISNLLGFRSCLDEVRERYDRYNLEYGLSHPTTTVRHRFRTMYRELHVGMEAPINQLRWLIEPKSDDENDLQLKVISILGVEGVGKSTLSQNIWRELEGQFEYKAFVQTAKMPDMKIVLHSILSQICPQQTPEACSVPNLIHDIRKHLQDKRYFIIIDDLWAVSVWDVLSRSFPEGNHCSRVITTTTIEDVALASCSYEPEHIFQLEPLDADHSYQLFISRVFGSRYGCPQQVNDISAYIASNCGGLPLAIICIATLVASQPETIEHWEFVQRFLRHNLRTSSTFAEILKQVLKLCFSSLPHCLKTCLLYLSAYPENYVFLKDDLVKQWIAEDFICTMEGMDLVEVASSYFDELLNLGLIQRIDTNSKKKGLSYVVHPTVFDFIAGKSSEDNFITIIDYSQPTVALTEKIHRLALHFGSATYATTAANIGQSQVRSIIFTGFLSCMPSLLEFKLVRVMILHLHADVGDTRFSLVEICKLLLLRYLQVSCSVTVILPAKMQCLKHLEILEINAVVSAVPSDILNHPSLLHVHLGRKAKHKHLTVGAVTSSDAVLLNDSGMTSYAPIQKFELLPPICSFSRFPLWIGQCPGLRSLEVLVRELWTYDLDLLGQLPALTDLSVYVREHTAWSAVTFRSGAFQVLRYLKLVCGVLPVISFLKEATPNLRRLKIGFNVHSGEEYNNLLSGIHHLPNLEKITASIGIATGADESDRIAAETVLTDAMDKHPCHPSFNVKRVGPVDKEYGSSGKKNKSQETGSSNERDKGMEKYIEILHECSSNEQPGILENIKSLNTRKDTDNGSFTLWSPALLLPASSVPSPMHVTFRLLEDITSGFSEEYKVGVGGYGVVYKGVLHNGEKIAVKKLYDMPGPHDRELEREFDILKMVHHENIIRFFGYCYELRQKHIPVNGELVLTNVKERALCFEYLQRGSLEMYLTDESSGFDWNTRYEIIKGICKGLDHLHNGYKSTILHLNLKPANIFLDDNMMPKIADFGLDRLFGTTKTGTMENFRGTRYTPSEYTESGQISKQYDIFCLGVIIIQIMTGPSGYAKCIDMPAQEFIELVQENWRKSLETKPYSSQEADCVEVKACIEIAVRCVQADQLKRPTIAEVINMLNEREAVGSPHPKQKSSSTSIFKAKGLSTSQQGKQKIVIEVDMKSEKARAKAMSMVASMHGVHSVAIEGINKDRLVVLGSCVDPVMLMTSLRKKLGHATFVSVGPQQARFAEKAQNEPTPWNPYTDSYPYPTQNPHQYTMQELDSPGCTVQ